MSLGVSSPLSQRVAWAGVRIELVTVGWMSIEAVVSIGAGILAHSLLLTAFGIDSVVELLSGGILLWRLAVQARGGNLASVETAEQRAAWVVAIALSLLCLYIVTSAAVGLFTRHTPESSFPGLVIAALAVVGMPILAWRKRQIAAELDSQALKGDAVCSITCAYMAATVFLGLAFTALFHWWWADSLASIAFLWFLVPETREAWEGARQGKAACDCGGDDCEEGA